MKSLKILVTLEAFLCLIFFTISYAQTTEIEPIIIITYDANGGYFDNNEKTSKDVIYQKNGSGIYIPDVNLQFPNRKSENSANQSGWMFAGWYLESGENYNQISEWKGYVDDETQSKTVYAKWLPFNDMPLTMSGITFIIMDRNMGAESVASGVYFSEGHEDLNKLGFYYQRGNNYGFNNVDTVISNLSGNMVVNETGMPRGPGNYYSNATFITRASTPYRWDDEDNANLWGGADETQPDSYRQGPCPEGYHVPLYKEWNKVLSLFDARKISDEGSGYCSNYSGVDSLCFPAKLKLPFAGYRYRQNSKVTLQGTDGFYRSSSRSDYEYAYRLRFNLSSMAKYGNIRAHGFSVRCFKDDITKNIEYELNGGDIKGNTLLKTSRRREDGRILPNPIKTGSIFLGRYLTSDFSGNPVITNAISDDSDGDTIILHAKWQECEEGYTVKNGRCTPEKGGINFGSGIIKISDGNDTIYLKDRNQGDIDDEIVGDFKFALVVEMSYIYRHDWQEECNYDDECLNEKVVEYVDDKLGMSLSSWEDFMNYYMSLEEKYGSLENLLEKVNGKYYFRGNNTGVNFDDLVVENDEILNKDYLISTGFDGGNFGYEEGSGWIEGNNNSPCDWDKGEYLPTSQDWKRLFGIWGNINGYELKENLDIIPVENVFVDGIDGDTNLFNLLLDIMIYGGKGIYYGDDMWIVYTDGVIGGWNGQDNNGEIGLEAIIPSQDDILLSIIHFNPENNISMDMEPNTLALPVRCFIKVPIVKFETNGGNLMDDIDVFKGEKIVLENQPSKSNATFDGWYKDAGLTEKWDIENDTVEDDMTLYAKWIENKPSGGSSGGGGGGNSNKSDTPKEDKTPADTPEQTSQDDKAQESQTGEQASDEATQRDKQNTQDPQITSVTTPEGPKYSDEFLQAYTFAKGKGITTTPTIQEAKMDGNLTRIQMAKMLSQYAMNVLGKTPDISKGTKKFNDVTNKMNKDYDNGVTLAYQLGIMGQNMPNNNFRPNDEVTRAEFVAAFSRMLYGTSDGEYESTSKYYTHHMQKLKEEGIVTNTNPIMKEKRGYVMVMLMRSVK